MDPKKYFSSYEDLCIHKLMLNDTERLRAYKDAIISNSVLFNNKVVLDVGAGTGILSVFAASVGAKKVYSVEAAPSLIPIIKNISAENNYSDVIEVIEGQIENLDLPEKVDIIISEWMGFYLLHEGMLDSVLYAKKFLKTSGVMFPSECRMFLSVCEVPEYFENWDHVCGIKMSSFGEAIRKASQQKPVIGCIEPSSLLSDPLEIFSFKLHDLDEKDLKHIITKGVVAINRDGNYQGVCIWFTVEFPSNCKNITLSTSPFSAPTHWKQTVIVLPCNVDVEEGEPIAFEIAFNKNGPRTYDITYSMLESDKVKHPSPCNCYNMKCQVIKAYLSEHDKTS